MGALTVISEGELGESDANITITSIPDTYDHLWMVTSIREAASYFVNLEYRFNDDSSPYSNTYLWRQSAASGTVSGRNTSSEVGDVISRCGGDSLLADTFSSSSLWIINYAGTDNFKMCLMQASVPNSSSTDDQYTSMLSVGLYAETPAINKIRMQGAGGPHFQQYTSYVLYGVTGV